MIVRGMLETLRRWWRGLFGKPEPIPEPREPGERWTEETKPRLSLYEVQQRVDEGRRRSQRGTSQHTGPGIRKLGRYRAGRQHEKRMGVDHSLTMRDIEEERKLRKRKR